MYRVVVNRYEIRKSLGRGGFAEVYLAYDQQLGREVALKQIFGSIEDSTFQKQRDREIRIHAQLTSKHVIALHDSFIFEDRFYLVLELMEHSLAQYTEPLDFDLVLEWIRDCLIGLQDIHSRGIIHRDIKPGNIFLDKDHRIRLGDFGVAMSGASASLAAWSPQYIAPEMVVGDQEQITPSSDLYSLGLVIYRLLLGEEGIRKAFPDVYTGLDRPEAINNRWLLWHNQTDKPAPPLHEIRTDIPEEFSNWLLKLIEKNPHNRCSSASEALNHLTKVTGLSPATDELSNITEPVT